MKCDLNQCWSVVFQDQQVLWGLIQGFLWFTFFACQLCVWECAVCSECHSCLCTVAPSSPSLLLVMISTCVHQVISISIDSVHVTVTGSCHYQGYSRDIQVFKICKLAKWWLHTLNQIFLKYEEKIYLGQFVSDWNVWFFALRFY